MTSNYSGTFTTKSTTYDRGMRSLVRHIFKNEGKNACKINDIDFESDRMRRVFVDMEWNFNYDEGEPDWVGGDSVSIRLWSIEDLGKRVRINYTTYWEHYCNECGKERTIEYAENLCDVCKEMKK